MHWLLSGVHAVGNRNPVQEVVCRCFAPMSAVAAAAVQAGAACLEKPRGGRGVLWVGCCVMPAQVVIPGPALVGSHAATIAAGMGRRLRCWIAIWMHCIDCSRFWGGCRRFTLTADAIDKAAQGLTCLSVVC